MNPKPSVFLIDEDKTTRRCLEGLCGTAGFDFHTFATEQDFLELPRPQGPGCLVLNLTASYGSGLETLRVMRDRPSVYTTTIVLSATGSVQLAVKCIKLGAIDFLQKPIESVELMQAVRLGLAHDEHRRRIDRQHAEALERLREFTPRERELVHLMCDGLSNKQIAAKLTISIKTVANHRAHLMAKARANNTADMVRLVMLAERPPDALAA